MRSQFRDQLGRQYSAIRYTLDHCLWTDDANRDDLLKRFETCKQQIAEEDKKAQESMWWD